jgi:triosephosphate isomerase
MSVMLCIGEMLSDRESGKTMDVCIEQLTACTDILKPEEWKRIVIAYEPVWAIGTGKVATPEQAEETHYNIRQWISSNVSSTVASEIRIVYGGSVKGSNCAELIKCPNIDGFLVGGASLLPEFVDIIKCAKGI